MCGLGCMAQPGLGEEKKRIKSVTDIKTGKFPWFASSLPLYSSSSFAFRVAAALELYLLLLVRSQVYNLKMKRKIVHQADRERLILAS